MGAGGAPATTNAKKNAVIQKNLETQTKISAATGKCVTVAISCFAQSDEDQFVCVL